MAPQAAGQPAADKGLCLSMHQPWASLLVFGIKRIEGRSWPTSHRGRIWVHATSQHPAEAEVEELEAFYRCLHCQLDGKPSIELPPTYPTGVLLGCVDVVDCLTAEQVEAWEGLPPSLKAEVGSPHCFLCQAPQRLVVLQQLRGWPKLWTLDKKVHRMALLGLKPAPNGADFSWDKFGSPPHAAAALPPSSNAQKFQKRQQQQRNGESGDEGSSGGGGSSSSGGGGKVARSGSGSAGGGKVARSGEAESPRAAATAATLAAATAGLPRALALAAAHAPPPHQQQRQQQQEVRQGGEGGGGGGRGLPPAVQLPPPPQQAQQAPAKRLRAVEKKLRQVESLAARQRGGGPAGVQPLSAEESAKLAQREALEAEASALRAQL